MDGEVFMSAPESLGEWMPVGVSWEAEGCTVEWIDFAGARMREPFFDRTVERLLENPCRNFCRFRTSMDELCDRHAPQAEARPGGLIFHVSRCGSTLVAGMLRALRQHVVLSEPAPLEQLLALRRQVKGVPEETWRQWLCGLLTVIGRRREKGEDCWFLKCDALHTLDLPFILSAFPGVPWMFLDRDEHEVIKAHLRFPGRAMVPGSILPGREFLHSPPDTPPEAHIAKVLGAVRAASRAVLEGGLFMGYRELPGEGWTKIVEHFGLKLKAGDEALVMEAADRDAKNPDRKWVDPLDLEDPAWVPASVGAKSPGVVEWRRIGTLRFTHPFFRDTIRAAGDAEVQETTIEKLEEFAAANPGLPPAGFIFHLSRCGSTLLTQMLAALPAHVVLSEPVPVNDLLWKDSPAEGEPLAETRLRAMLAVLGRRRFTEEERFFVKFDAWHTLNLPLIRRAFPEVPWVFLYRDPVEVLVSHALSPGTHTLPGQLDPARLGVEPPAWTEPGLRKYAAQVLARIGTAALEHLDEAGRLVHYAELPGALPGVLRHFKVEATEEEMQMMLRVAARYSKVPQRKFTPDTALRQSQATPEMRAIAREWLGDIYVALEKRREAQSTI
jgi:hypothetical protein